ncbi:MAG: Flagellar export protein FliJ [Microbacteriaceae bacterium]|jgi:flagellar FliJ protein|nr:Flagellar export protein FliJ [Microbacteriaceae bacterium]
MARAFRLASLLRLRQVQQDQAASDLAAAHARAREATVRQNRTKAALGAAPTEPTSSSVLYAIAAARASSRSMLAELGAVAQREEAHVEAAAAAYAEARARSLGLEKLEGRHAEHQAATDLAAEQTVVDEIASTSIHRTTGRGTP